MKWTLIAACVASGALVFVVTKHLFETHIAFSDGSVSTFRCPCFIGLTHFLAISMLPILQSLHVRVRHAWDVNNPEWKPENLEGSWSMYQTICYTFGWRNLSVSACNVITVLFNRISLLYVSATVHAVLRQGNIPMTVAARLFIFQKSCPTHQIAGVCTLLLGLVFMVLVAHQHEVDEQALGVQSQHSHSASDVVFGVGFLFVACVLLAARYVAEEIIMKEDKIPPLVVAGAQGFIGVVVAANVLVVAHHMGYEDFWNTTEMLVASSLVQMLLVELFALNIMFQFSMAYVTQVFDATCKAMVRGTGPISVWLLQLCFFYAPFSAGQQYGERWVSPGSWHVLFGASIVTTGLCLYFYPADKSDQKQKDEEKAEQAHLIEKANRAG